MDDEESGGGGRPDRMAALGSTWRGDGGLAPGTLGGRVVCHLLSAGAKVSAALTPPATAMSSCSVGSDVRLG